MGIGAGPTTAKLGVKIKNGRFVITCRDMPDPDEARRLWREGKTREEFVKEQRRKKAKP